MRNQGLMLVLALLVAGCGKGEECVDCESDTDTDTDTDSDTDTDTDVEPGNDTIDEAEPIEVAGFDDAAADDGIEVAGDRDFWAAELVEGTYYWAFVAGGGDGGEPDCVLRIYDPSKTQIGECDDLPYRISETDPGFFFRAAETGTYYFEVLEWTDWLDDEYDADGGANWDYELFLAEAPYTESNEDVNADNDTIEQEGENYLNESYSFFLDPWSEWLESDGGWYFAAGAIHEPGDVDNYALNWDSDEPGAIEFSLFPGYPTELDPVFELYNSSGDLVATTDDPAIYPASLGLYYDSGIRFFVDAPDTYFLQIKDAGGAGDSMHYYVTMGGGYGWNADVVTTKDWTLEGIESDPLVQNTDLIVQESTTTADYFYGYGASRLEDGDTWDSWVFADGVEGMKTLEVEVVTAGIGSMLDAKVTVYDGTGAVVGTATGRSDSADDPLLITTLPDSVTAPLYAVVEAENDERGLSAFYEIGVTAYYE